MHTHLTFRVTVCVGSRTSWFTWTLHVPVPVPDSVAKPPYFASDSHVYGHRGINFSQACNREEARQAILIDG